MERNDMSARYGVEFQGVSLHAEVDDLTEVNGLLNGHEGRVHVFDRTNGSILFEGSADDVRKGLGAGAVLRAENAKRTAEASGDLPRRLVWKDLDIPLLIPAPGVAEPHARDVVDTGVPPIDARLQSARETIAMLEDQVRTQVGQLKSLALQLLDAEYRERRRLAALLHDNVQQLLVAAKIRIHHIVQCASGDDVANAAKEANRLIQQSLSLTRSLTTETSSPLLNQCGFRAAIEWLGDDMGRQFKLTIVTQLDPKAEPADHGVKAFLYQAVRELLFNAVKHAHADVIHITSMLSTSNRLHISVDDAGVGFDPAQGGLDQRSKNSQGLASIAKRVTALGGTMHIDSKPNTGTRVHIDIPFHGSAIQDET